jgi:uncharacterized protein
MTQIGLFLGLVFGVTWPLIFRWRPPVAPESVWAFLAPLLPVFWAPTVIALVLIGSTEGARGLRRELRARLLYTRGTLRWFVIAGAVPAIAVAIAVASGRAAGHGASFIPLTAVLPMIGVQVITGAVGEELGWRGFLLPRLGRRIGRMQAAFAMAILWSIWHVPAFFTPGMPHQVMPMPLTLAFIALFGLFMAFVFDRTGGSVLATVLAHLSLNIASGIGGVELSSTVFWGVLVVIFGLRAVLMVITSRVGLKATQ